MFWVWEERESKSIRRGCESDKGESKEWLVRERGKNIWIEYLGKKEWHKIEGNKNKKKKEC